MGTEIQFVIKHIGMAHFANQVWSDLGRNFIMHFWGQETQFLHFAYLAKGLNVFPTNFELFWSKHVGAIPGGLTLVANKMHFPEMARNG